MVREGQGTGVMDVALELIGHTDLATRMSAAAVLYNVSRLLPKEETIEVLQLASGLAHHLKEKTDGETGEEFLKLRPPWPTPLILKYIPAGVHAGLRLMLSMARLVHRNDAAVSLLHSLEFDPNGIEVTGVETENMRSLKGEVDMMLKAQS